MTVDLHKSGMASLTPVIVVPYQNHWPRDFERLAQPLYRSLQTLITDLQHIGGTAVPDLAGSPVIDMLLITRSLQTFDGRHSQLHALGYRRVAHRSSNNQRVFQLGIGHKQHAQLFVCETGSQNALHHLLVRDFLRHNEAERNRYSALKLQLLAADMHNPRGYSAGKRPRLTRLLEHATGRR